MLILDEVTEYSQPNDDFDLISQKLTEIFLKELNKKDSIFLKIDRGAISKISMFIAGAINRSASIGIAGETASGKSTVTFDIINTIEEFAKKFQLKNIITRVNTDDYYYDRSDMVKKAGSFAEFAKDYDFDVPHALELELMKKHIFQLLAGKTVMLPKYDMSGTAIRYDNHTPASPSKIVISEGLFTLTEKICDAFDFKIYVDIDSATQEERFYARAKERNLGDSAKDILANASQKAEVYIKPCKENADIVLSGEAERSRYVDFVKQVLNLIKEFHLG